MPYIPPEVLQEIKKVDLKTYLKEYEPRELVHFSGDVYTKRTHDSIKISNGKWTWWGTGIGGRTALDYLIKVRGLNFMEAAELMLDQIRIKPLSHVPMPEQEELKEKKLLLPEPYRYQEYVASYLRRRGIDEEIIEFCLKTGRIYESAYHHNAVFVGMDKDRIPRYENKASYVELIKAVMMQESSGLGTDPMGSSESEYNVRYPRAPNEILEPEYSIYCGVLELKDCLIEAEVENPIDIENIRLALQRYNAELEDYDSLVLQYYIFAKHLIESHI